jgi:cytochrome c oxidase accessory protein FixG
VKQLATFQAPFAAWLWIGILTLTTYTFAGHMREQVCTYMCPWPRIQAALTDEWALNVTYKYDRGEPRTSVKKAAALREAGEVAGDCVDCNQCVAVCPTGIDIRDGAQLECIQCGLCIDACDNVMARIGRPARLIGYDSEVNLERRVAGKPEVTRIVRPRTILYSALIAVVGAIMLVTLLDRTFLDVNVLHDRNPVAVKLSDGSIRNGYTLHLLNKRGFQRTVAIDVDGPTGVQIHAVTLDSITPDRPMVTLERDATTEVRVVLIASSENLAASTPVRFRVTDLGLGEVAVAADHFINPQP